MKPYLTKADVAQRYPTDLTDEQWERLEPCLPAAKPGGLRKIDLRQVLNGILYLELAGCAWRMLPYDFPAGKRFTRIVGIGNERGCGTDSTIPFTAH